MYLGLGNFIIVSVTLFVIGIVGFLANRKNILLLLLALEIMLLAVNLNFVVFSVFLDYLLGQLFTLIVLTVAAAESALGLAILIVYYRVRGGIASSVGAWPSSAGTLDQRTVSKRMSSSLAGAGTGRDIVDRVLPCR
jgi:NADH-quinone oxidoreductase subunit K